jgi:aspartyl-tRNA(Asn)/glutamyl-tRNA(Gln) amidotransferase subunit C
MEFDKEKIENLIKLARLELTEEEKEKFSNDLNKILSYVEKIQSLDLDVEPLISSGLWMNDFREDEIFLDQDIVEKIIENFPDKEGRYLKVPKVL